MENKNIRSIYVLPSARTLTACDGDRLLDVLVAGGVYLTSPCGGRGTCGKCRVRLLSGSVSGTEPDGDGYILSCRARVADDLTVSLDRADYESVVTLVSPSPDREAYAVLDVGTTTLAAMLVDAADGTLIATASCLNPQAAFGSDVLSRIHAANEGRLQILQQVLLSKIGQIITGMCGGARVRRLYVTANTVMLHIFFGISPRSIGVYPFTPIFTEARYTSGESLGLPVDEVCALPSSSGYIGADVIAGAVYLGMHTSTDTSLLVDIGTNGEIILTHRGRAYATSCAAGPALEGACIECGVGGIPGAIGRIEYSDGRLSYTTVRDAEPIGLCGSALIDLIAILIGEGIIDETGALAPDSPSPLSARLTADRFYITDTVYISLSDVRQFQLAKAAVCAGIEAILAEAGVSADEVGSMYIAGGMGEYMDVNSAAATGLIPERLLGVARAVGNTSLSGAAAVSRGDITVGALSAFARAVNTVELSASEVFRKRYIDNMYF